MPNIRCGKCKGSHESVAAVKFCYHNYDRVSNDLGQAAEMREGAAMQAKERAEDERVAAFKAQRDDAADLAWLTDGPMLDAKGSNEPRATQKQIEYMMALEARKLPAEHRRSLENMQAILKAMASDAIGELVKMPDRTDYHRPSTDADVPQGRYAIERDGEWRFYRVDRPTDGRWAGRTFVKIQASDELWPVKNPQQRTAVLNSIVAAGIQESMLAYGKQLGHCGHCGRTLTNPESIERGIGPVCFSKMGW